MTNPSKYVTHRMSLFDVADQNCHCYCSLFLLRKEENFDLEQVYDSVRIFLSRRKFILSESEM